MDVPNVLKMFFRYISRVVPVYILLSRSPSIDPLTLRRLSRYKY